MAPMRVAPLLLLVGCAAYDPDGIPVEAPCDLSILDMEPFDGQDNAWNAGPLWLDLSCPAPLGVVTLTGPGMTRPAGLLSHHHGDHQLRFEPVEALEPATPYGARFEIANARRDWTFVTGPWGAPVLGALEERSLALRPAQGTLLDPPGPGAALTLLPEEGFHPVLQFLGNPTQGEVPVRVGARGGDNPLSGQDGTRGTFDAVASWDDPRATVGPRTLTWTLSQGHLVVEDAVWTIDVGPDLMDARASLVGRWDTRTTDAGQGACDSSIEVGGPPCEACEDGAVACLPFRLETIPADPWSGVLVVVDES